MVKTTLTQTYFGHEGALIDKWEQYLEVYRIELSRFVEKGNPVRLLEIGVQNGGSLELWAKYLPPQSTIIGIDIDPKVGQLSFDDNISVFVCDIKDEKRVSQIVGSDEFDIIIDDGSHRYEDVIGGFRFLFSRLAPGGLYIAEDLHTSYWAEYGGGLRQRSSSIEWFKNLIDALNADHLELGGEFSEQALTELRAYGRWIARITFYDSVVVVEKLDAEKGSPYRRILSGAEDHVVRALDLIASPRFKFGEVLLGAATFRRIDSEYLEELCAARSRGATLDESLKATRAELQVKEQDIAQLKHENANLDTAIDALEKQLAKFEHDLRELETGLAVRQTQLTRFERDQRSLQANIAAREAHVAIIESELNRVASERDVMLNSRAWRASQRMRRALARVSSIVGHSVITTRLLKRTKTAIGSSDLFDAAWYLAQYTDVEASGVNPLAHYLTSGANEGRDPNPLFDAKWYLAQYPDVGAAGMNPLAHYVLYGAKEGRDPNPLFDTDWYLAQYADVAAGMNPLAHYLTSGANEGRDPSPHFDADWYVARCPEVEKLGLNPLTHYLLKGRAEGRLTVDPNKAYTKHVLKEQQRFAIEQPEILRHVEVMLHKPTFVVAVEGSDRQARERTMAALKRQLYPYWRACDFSGSLSIAEAATLQEGEYFLWLRAGDLLHERALYMFASALNMDPAMDLVYADEDELLDGCTRSKPFYKPDWSPDYLESFNYIGPAACFGGSLASECWAGTSGYYDFVLRFTERTDRIVHLRSVVCHRERGATETRSESEAASDIEALNGRLRRTGRIGTIAPSAAALGCYDAKLKLSSKPLVSLVIPTAGKIVEIDGRRIDLIINCLDTIAERSTYRNLEFVIVDNGDLGDARVEALRKRGCNMITFGEQRLNVAKKLNLGASIATGEMLLLLNDDIEPLNPDWVERLLEQLEKPHVGVVGAKLLYPNGKIQHVGAVLNSGNPDHVRRLHPRDDLGYFFSTCGTRNFSAVTGATMMTRTEIYRRVGGYNEALPVNFNDVDYCLKVRECGYTVVYTPQAELVHFESQSREAKVEHFELEYFHKRWAEMVTIDPFYNEENLTVSPPTFEVEHNRRQL